MATDPARELPAAHARFATAASSFVEGLLPPDALRLPATSVIRLLRERFAEQIDAILEAPQAPADRDRSPHDASPVAAESDTSWLTRTRMIGVNVRTVGSFWRVVHYLLTVPAVYDSVHLLPIWEPGVVASLYGMASWEINPEFFDPELAAAYPNLGTPAEQLRATVDLIHLTGRAVGLDVIPHTDRYSQIVLANPSHFEWLRRRGTRIVDHRAELHEEVAYEIHRWLAENGPARSAGAQRVTAVGGGTPDALFSADTPEAVRNLLLFGEPADREGRLARRLALVDRLYSLGYEPVPATMAPPYRGLEVDRKKRRHDAAGRLWYDYRIAEPGPMSRVFGPLTRYKLYERLDDNREWRVDFNRPRPEVFEYLASHVAELQRRYGFDFMRGDMSHVQMRPEGPPLEPGRYYDPLAYVKRTVQKQRRSFAYFAESFLSPPGTMGYGDEVDHLEASDADVVLGNLQSVAVADPAFLSRLRRYLDIATGRRVTPCFTVMTGDKDDPRFDAFYLAGNELRCFLSLFLPALPSYTALGFELRDRHERPAPNEYYTKLYVFHEERGPKATRGPYRFGTNRGLFSRITGIRAYADAWLPTLPAEARRPEAVRWLLPPDPTAGTRVVAWTLTGAHQDLLFVANTDTFSGRDRLVVPLPRETGAADPLAALLFSTHADGASGGSTIAGDRVQIEALAAGEARIYAITEQA
ncbi:MAG: hypothetical protein ACLFUA_05730 [Spirochaetales bacterium]